MTSSLVERFWAKQDERFWSKVDRWDPDGCWLWIGPRDEGYGRFVPFSAHRYAYETLVGPIPEGLQIDHLCRVRACVNPKHLEPVTPAVNTFRGDTNGRKRFCLRGHPFDEENTYRSPRGDRSCRACGRERSRAWKRKRAAA